MDFLILELKDRPENSSVLHRVYKDGKSVLGLFTFVEAINVVLYTPVQDDDTVVEKYQSSGRTVTRTGKEWREAVNSQ